jgi:hypothetical protein
MPVSGPVATGSIAVLYENEAWMAPLFAALEFAQLPYRKLFADDVAIDPLCRPDDALLVNKVSASSYLRGHLRSIGFARTVLAHYESAGVPVVNGSRAYDLEISKANVGGSGALMRAFDDLGSLEAAAAELDFGVDGTLLAQELVPTADAMITRLELLDGEPLYAIRVETNAALGFNLCPADICQVPDEPDFENWVADAARQQRRIARAGALDVCGIEVLVDARTGAHVFYDINALSNFVTDAERIVGFDPHARFAEYLARRAGLAAAIA